MTSSNMTCDAFDAALPDYLEGTLDEKRLALVDGHLSECVRCASLLRDLENIRRDAAALPDLVPSRDLWEGIEARIAAPVIPLAAPRPEKQRRMVPAWLGIAAAALIVSTAGVTYLLTSRSMHSGSDSFEDVATSAPSAQSPIAAVPAATTAGTEPAGTNARPTAPVQSSAASLAS